MPVRRIADIAHERGALCSSTAPSGRRDPGERARPRRRHVRRARRRSGCSAPRASARCGSGESSSRTPARPLRASSRSPQRLAREPDARDRCAPVPACRATTGRRCSAWAVDRLADDVRGARLRLPPGRGDGPPGGRHLASIDGVTLLTPRDRMAGLISFRIRGWDPQPPSRSCRRGRSASHGRCRWSTRCASAPASGRPRTRSTASWTGFACSPRTRPSRSRRGGR